MKERKEWGFARPTCACGECVDKCRHMPGYLIPSDLDRMVPVTEKDVFAWAERNLLASPGAIARRNNGQRFRIPTLVPAVQQDGSCIHLSKEGRCQIHAVAPFGCAFFSCQNQPHDDALAAQGMRAVMLDHATGGLYSQIWHHLDALGKRQKGPEELRKRLHSIAPAGTEKVA